LFAVINFCCLPRGDPVTSNLVMLAKAVLKSEL
jgi:hypothetical protein